jgi:hypothetical protein
MTGVFAYFHSLLIVIIQFEVFDELVGDGPFLLGLNIVDCRPSLMPA